MRAIVADDKGAWLCRVYRHWLLGRANADHQSQGSSKQNSPVADDAERGRSAAELRMIRLQAHLRDQCLGQRIPGVAEAVCDGKVIVARSRYVIRLDPVRPETGRVFE